MAVSQPAQQPYRPEEARVIARYRAMLSDSMDREAQYAALADSLADQVAVLERELRLCRAGAAVNEVLPGVPSGD